MSPSSEGAEAGATGVLVDEQFGSNIPEQAREHGLKLAMPVEKSGQDEFDFEYGDDFAAHIEKFNPDFSKVLVRYNPDGDAAHEQGAARAAEAARGLAPRDRPQVPVRAAGPRDRRAARLRRRRHRSLRRGATAGAHAPGDRGRPELRASRSTSGRSRASTSNPTPRCSPSRPAPARVARASSACCSVAAPRPRRSSSGSRQAAPVEGFIGFAIGRSIWWDALKGCLDKRARRETRRRADRQELPALHQGLRASGSALATAPGHASRRAATHIYITLAIRAW